MRSNKLINLITALSNKEKHKIHLQLSRNKKTKNYLILFETIAKNENDNLTKETLFFKIYNEPYSPHKDYLLRNTYRNLAKKIEAYLIEETFHQEIQKNLNIHNYYLLKSFKHLRLYNLFSSNYKDSINNAVADGDYLTASSITSLQVNNYLHHITPTPKNFEKANNLLSLQMMYLSAYYLNNQYQTDIKRKHIANIIEPKTTTKLNYYDKNEELYENYLLLKYNLFDNSTNNKTALIKECLSILNKLPKTYSNVVEEIQFCKLSLAHEYTNTANYNDANIIYEELLNGKTPINDTLEATLIFDYISNLIRQENYNTALKAVNTFTLHINKHSTALQQKLKFITLMLYAFLKKDALLQEHAPICNNLIDYEKYWCRFLYGIISYLRSDFDDAYRECINLKNSLRYKGPKFDVRDILNFYIRFFNLLKNNTDNKNHLISGLNKLQHDMALYSTNALPEFKEYLPFLWLKKEVSLVTAT